MIPGVTDLEHGTPVYHVMSGTTGFWPSIQERGASEEITEISVRFRLDLLLGVVAATRWLVRRDGVWFSVLANAYETIRNGSHVPEQYVIERWNDILRGENALGPTAPTKEDKYALALALSSVVNNGPC